MTNIMKHLGVYLLLMIGLLVVTGCPHPQPITTLTTTVDPAVVTMAIVQGQADADQNHTCSPATPPSPPLPGQWWLSLPAAQLPKVAGHGIVGFHLWRNRTDSCLEYRQDLYRTGFSYDLAPIQNLKGLITKAALSFTVAVMPAVRPNSLCQDMTGGGGSLMRLRQGATLPQGSFVELGTVTSDPSGRVSSTVAFPDSGREFGMTFPWVPGQIAPGVATSAGGGNMAGFTVDVTNLLSGAINRGDAALSFMLSGSDESRPTVSPPDSFDCRTTYHIGQLVITHY